MHYRVSERPYVHAYLSRPVRACISIASVIYRISIGGGRTCVHIYPSVASVGYHSKVPYGRTCMHIYRISIASVHAYLSHIYRVRRLPLRRCRTCMHIYPSVGYHSEVPHVHAYRLATITTPNNLHCRCCDVGNSGVSGEEKALAAHLHRVPASRCSSRSHEDRERNDDDASRSGHAPRTAISTST